MSPGSTQGQLDIRPTTSAYSAFMSAQLSTMQVVGGYIGGLKVHLSPLGGLHTLEISFKS